MAKIDVQEFESQREKLVSGLVACAEQLRTTAKACEDFAQFFNALDGEAKGKGKELVFAEDDGSKKRKRASKPKDPNAPKRPASSYILFQNAIRSELRKQFPEITNAELLSMISEKWKSMPAEDKEEYAQHQAELKSRYSEEKKAYDSRSPEEIEAANKAIAEAAATKKANGGRRKAKAEAAPVAAVQARPPPQEVDSDEESDADEESDEEPAAPVKTSKKQKEPSTEPSTDSGSDEEDDEEEEEEVPAPKRKRAGSAQPKSRKK